MLLVKTVGESDEFSWLRNRTMAYFHTLAQRVPVCPESMPGKLADWHDNFLPAFRIRFRLASCLVDFGRLMNKGDIQSMVNFDELTSILAEVG